MRKTRSVVTVAAVVALGMASAACAAFRGSWKEPVVTFRDLKLTGVGTSGGSLEIQLSVYNPNSFRLDGTRLTYNLAVDSIPLGNGVLDQAFTVQENDSTIVRLPLSFTYAGLGAAGRQLMQTGAVNYRVTGDVTVNTPIGSRTRAYDRTGRFTTLAGNAR
ncbi:MAG: LEA type 2 family protein [Gemmatimonadaceae bacterium]